ncbi:hypothetical protein QAD02_015714 [Eretmocerus hayati]|uniref:Uncharacterized protein n=1 Tax=Eretmocerus hayati TaxID=131215 RepID=A0ACC2P9G4_9HYME|nr:hypothetical protein QAD02_015714 [Eretmocerus hayati]
MDFIHRLMAEDDSSLLPEFDITDEVDGLEMNIYSDKSLSKSTEFRERGDDLFNQCKSEESINRMILSLYSKSIAYAPADSEELALAYSNRSLLWLRLQQHDFCNFDIDKALKITESKDLKEKLVIHKKVCLKSKKSCKPRKHVLSDVPKLLPSSNIPCGADCISVECNEEYGRHFVATRDIEAGEIILNEQTSYASVDLHNLYLVCSHCLAYAWTGIPCDSCVFTIYCSESCKREAWSEYHDVLCPMLPFLICKPYRNVACAFLNVLRMLIVIIRKEGLETVISEAKRIDGKIDENKLLPCGVSDCTKFSSVYSLKSEFDEECFEKDLFELGLNRQTTILMKLLNKSPILMDHQKQQFSKKVILSSLRVVLRKLFVIYSSNNFKFEDVQQAHKNLSVLTDISGKGNILGACSSLINHSCDPNICRIFIPGPKIIMFTVRPVKKGEQLLISYGANATEVTELRQQQLRETFSFWCNCKPCVEDWPELDTLVSKIENYRGFT